MSMRYVNMISNRLSLRKPQRDSLEILNRICEIVTLQKHPDVEQSLETIQSEFSQVKAFDRDFISLCFALATGVGKTRLMGAFISYLYLEEGIRHFFVLSPNLTIYNKLIEDFTPNTPKYVFKGIGEFAQNPPLIVTGDTYESGIGIRNEHRAQLTTVEEDVHINIFNIAKIVAKDKGHYAKDDERKNVPRIRRLSEYIGDSYFDYLAGLEDLVVLMDESHRYRADAGLAAINELNPILGLELTATPHTEKANKTEPFNNVIYSYPLSAAMNDGFVKEPAVATRENFDSSNFTKEGLEKVKLEDGVRIHENTKIDLEIFARNNDLPTVKPFMLVVAEDTLHANTLQQLIESDSFFEGRYGDKVITVHSNIKGNEKDDVIQNLLKVEDPDNKVEIVIHVNMLKEGWDVTNLYTIVPLRAANSKTLVEQSIGRGLRLPYGKRVGDTSVDRLTIVSHDRFQEIIDHANDPNSIIRVGIIIGRDIPEKGKKLVSVKSNFDNILTLSQEQEKNEQQSYYSIEPDPDTRTKVFENEIEIGIAKVTLDVLTKFEGLKGSQELQKSEIQKQIIERVKKIAPPVQLATDTPEVDIEAVVIKTTTLFQQMSIDIPKIVVLPKGEVHCGYEDFDLDVENISPQPVTQDILIRHLHDREQYTITSGAALVEEKRPEDYIVRGLIDYDDINYDDHAALLYKLASQVTERLRTYLKDEDEFFNVLQFHQQTLVKLVYAQMQDHFVETATSYEAHVTKGFRTLQTNNFSIPDNEEVRDFRIALKEGEKNQIKSMLFGRFKKCLYPAQKFDSDTERRFSVIVENDKSVQKWFKPAKGVFQIHFTQKDSYEPDFVVETDQFKYLCEPKRASEMTDDIVLQKAKAAATWCEHASKHAKDTDGKKWKYLLIPHDQMSEQKTLEGLAAGYLFANPIEH